MSSDQKYLPYPYIFVDYDGPIRITYLHEDGSQSGGSQEVGPIISKPDGCKDDPRVVVQAIDNGRRENGSAWTWDEALDHGRGAWVTYDPGIHPAPNKSKATEPDVGTESRSVALSSTSKVIFEADEAPKSAAFDDVEVEDEDNFEPVDADFEDTDENEPSYEDEDED